MKKFLLLIPLALLCLLPLINKSSEGYNRTPGSFEALEMWSHARSYPQASFPQSGFEQAYFKMKEAEGFLKDLSDDHEWEKIGPNNTSGRALAVAINPVNDEVWMGSASGGIWKTATQGNGVDAWSYVETGFPVLGVSSVAIAADGNQIYAGTGEVYNYMQAGTGAAYRETRGSYGIGILKSNDGGATWFKALDWSYNQQHGVNEIAIDPSNSNRVFAATSEGVLRSDDAGMNWTSKLSVINATDIIIHHENPNVLVAVCGNFSSEGHGLYRSIDGGENWNQINGGLPDTYAGKGHLAISPSNPDRMYASFGNGFWEDTAASWLCRSSDGGATWDIVNTTDYSLWQGWFGHGVAVDPDNEDHIYIIGITVWESFDAGDEIIEISEGGVTYGTFEPGEPDGDELYVHSDLHDIVIDPNNPDRFYLACDGGMFRSEDGGNSFRSINGGLQTTQFYPGFSSSRQRGDYAMGGLQDNSTVIYRGQGEWQRAPAGDGSWTAVHPTNDDIVFTSWQFLRIMRSTDNGVNWAWQDAFTIPDQGITSFIAPYVLCPSNPNVMYAGRSYIYKSFNQGGLWNETSGVPLDGNPAFSMAASESSTSKVYVVTAPNTSRSGAFVTYDGGDTWENITGILPDRYLMDVVVDPQDDNVVYVAVGGFGSAHLYKSFDSGVSWNQIGEGLVDVPTNAVAVDPMNSDHVYVGNDVGVFFSEDGGESFIPWNEGLFTSAVLVMDLNVSPSNRKLRIASHGNGAFQRDLVFDAPEVGIADIEPGILVYPNPTQDFIYVNGVESGLSYSIMDLSGKLLKSGVYNQVIAVDELAVGAYLLEFEGKGSFEFTKVN